MSGNWEEIARSRAARLSEWPGTLTAVVPDTPYTRLAPFPAPGTSLVAPHAPPPLLTPRSHSKLVFNVFILFPDRPRPQKRTLIPRRGESEPPLPLAPPPWLGTSGTLVVAPCRSCTAHDARWRLKWTSWRRVVSGTIIRFRITSTSTTTTTTITTTSFRLVSSRLHPSPRSRAHPVPTATSISLQCLHRVRYAHRRQRLLH